MMTLTRSGYALPGTSLNFKTGNWRSQKPLHQLRAAPCHNACPAGENAQAYLAKVNEGQNREAWEVIVRVNPLPAVTGRVCHHPCESACNRGEYDEAIAIHNVERYLGDQAIEQGWRYPCTPPASHAAKVAVVGSGPAGLSAAYHLTLRGHRVTLFEALSEAGGTLRTAIPAYRLPRHVLDAEIGRILSVGMEFRPRHRLGRDMSLNELRDDYQAVFLAPGTQKSREWSIDGATPRDLHVGLDLLKQWVDVGSVPTPKSAAIVGGGNTSVDLARILRRAGVEEVHLITYQALPGQGDCREDEMSAIPREIAQAQEEGVIIHDHRGIRRLILRGERVVGVEMVRMKRMDKGNGKIELVAFEGTETVLHVDQVIPAIGQVLDATGMEYLLNHKPYFEHDSWGRILNHPGFYVGGDARGDSGTVSGAVGHGRRAAQAIDAFIRHQEEELENPSAQDVVKYSQLNLHYFEHAKRSQEPVLAVQERKGFEEIDGGLSGQAVFNESRRCFSCGNCLACDNCWTLCPDTAVLKTKDLASDGSHYVFDYDYCKGCGLCAHECPCGYIVMRDEA